MSELGLKMSLTVACGLIVLLCGTLAYRQGVQPISCSFASECLDVGVNYLCCNFSNDQLPRVFIGGVRKNFATSDRGGCDTVYHVLIEPQYDGLEISLSYGSNTIGHWRDTIRLCSQNDTTVSPQPSGTATSDLIPTSTPGSSNGPTSGSDGRGLAALSILVVGLVPVLVVIIALCLVCRKRRNVRAAQVAGEADVRDRNGNRLVDNHTGGSRTLQETAEERNEPEVPGDLPMDLRFRGDAKSHAKLLVEDVSYSTQEESSSQDSSSICFGSWNYRNFLSSFHGRSEHACFSEEDVKRLAKLKPTPCEMPNFSSAYEVVSDGEAIIPVQPVLKDSRKKSGYVPERNSTKMPSVQFSKELNASSDVLTDSDCELPFPVQPEDDSVSLKEELSSAMNAAAPEEDLECKGVWAPPSVNELDSHSEGPSQFPFNPGHKGMPFSNGTDGLWKRPNLDGTDRKRGHKGGDSDSGDSYPAGGRGGTAVDSVMKGIHLSDDQTSAYVSGTSRSLKWNVDEEINCYCSNICPIQPVDDDSSPRQMVVSKSPIWCAVE